MGGRTGVSYGTIPFTPIEASAEIYFFRCCQKLCQNLTRNLAWNFVRHPARNIVQTYFWKIQCFEGRRIVIRIVGRSHLMVGRIVGQIAGRIVCQIVGQLDLEVKPNCRPNCF